MTKKKNPTKKKSASTSVSRADAFMLQKSERKNIQEELIRWSCCFGATLLIYLLVAFAIVNMYHPDTESLIKKGLEISVMSNFQPEPVESMLFWSGLLIFPLFLVFFYGLSLKPFFSRVFKKDVLFYVLFSAIIVGIVILFYVTFDAANPYYHGEIGLGQSTHDKVADTNFKFYFLGSVLQRTPWIYAFVCFPLCFLFFFFVLRKAKGAFAKAVDVFVSIFGCLIVAFLLYVIVTMNTYDFPLTWQAQYDFNAVYYSMTQVFAGSQMLVDGFTNTYGLYPHFLNPLFQLIGLDVYNFSLVMSLLIVVCLVFVFVFMRKFVKNPTLLFLGFISAIMLSYMANRLITEFDSYFCMFPIRLLAPTLTMFLTALLFWKKIKVNKVHYSIVYYGGMVLLSFLILWNVEFGLVSFIAWLLMLSYADFYTEEKQIAWKKIIKHWLIGIASVVIAFLLYGFLQKIIYGNFPNFQEMFEVLTVFGKLGFYMLPMPLWHPWMIVLLVYVIALIYAIAKVVRKEITPKSTAIFLVAILGCGLFSYYQGRSHNWTFSLSFLFFFICLTFLADELWAFLKKSNFVPFYAFFGIILFVLSFSVIDVFASKEKLLQLSSQIAENENLRQSQRIEEMKIKKSKEFINENLPSENKLLLFTSNKFQGLYLDGVKKQSGVNPGFIDLFFKTDVERYVRAIRDSSYTIFLDPKGFFYKPHREIVNAIAASRYIVKETLMDTTVVRFAMLEKPELDVPVNQFFVKHPDLLFYEKYDTAIYEKRIQGAKGVDYIDEGSVFTMEILVYPYEQIYQGAILVGNGFDSTGGFSIMKSINLQDKNEYMVAKEGQGFSIQIEMNQWNYVVLQVDGDVYWATVNAGTPLRVNFSSIYKNIEEDNKLYIGDFDEAKIPGRRIFMGEINEIMLTKRMKPFSEIQETYNRIKQIIK